MPWLIGWTVDEPEIAISPLTGPVLGSMDSAEGSLEADALAEASPDALAESPPDALAEAPADAPVEAAAEGLLGDGVAPALQAPTANNATSASAARRLVWV